MPDHLRGGAHRVHLRPTGQRSHAHPVGGGCTDGGRGEALGQRRNHRLLEPGRHDGPTDGRALLPRLRRHLARDFLDEQVEFLGPRYRVRTKDGAVERVGFHIEAHRVLHHGRAALELLASGRRAGEGHDILLFEMVEHVARAATHQLNGALGQDAGVHDRPEHRFGEMTARRGGLHDARHTGQERRRQLLEHAPHGEVEGVDVHRHAFDGHQDVASHEGAVLR